MERLFDTSPYEVEQPESEWPLVELMKYEEVIEEADRWHDAGRADVALAILDQWEASEDVRRAADGA